MKAARLTYLAAVIGCLSPAVPAALALDWQTQVVDARAAPLQAELTVRFPFVNRGLKPVAIRQIRPNCDCLEAAADRASYAPGEGGYIQAVFTVGDRIGAYERVILVETDEDSQPVRLLVKVDVPATAEIEPRMVEWARRAEPAAKSVEIRVAAGLTVEFTSAVATSEHFTTKLEAIEPGHRYRLTITPDGTSAPVNTAVRVRGRAGDGREIVVSAYANVR